MLRKKIPVFRIIIQLISLLFILIIGSVTVKILFLMLAISTVVGGAFFCGWICPFGFLQDISTKLARKFSVKKRTIPKHIHYVLIGIRYLLFIFTILFVVAPIINIVSYDPRISFLNILLKQVIPIIGILLLLFFLVVSLFYDRFFCRYFCVQGAQFGILGSARIGTIVRDENTCISCDKCNRACPMQIDVANNKSVLSLQCVNCFSCIEVCPTKKSSLKISIRPFTKKGIAMYIVTVIVVFFAIISMARGVVFKEDTTLNNTQVLSVENREYRDGIYEGSGRGFKGLVTVKVSVLDQKIEKIEVVSHNDDAPWFDRVYPSLTNKIIESQKIDVDVVTGATYSSKGVITAIKNALEKAYKLKNNKVGDTIRKVE